MSSSDYAEQVWIWENDEGSEFFFDVGEVVRFRIEAEEWNDQIPNAPELGDETPTDRRPPYSILVRSLFILQQSPLLTSFRVRCKWAEQDLLRGGRLGSAGLSHNLAAECLFTCGLLRALIHFFHQIRYIRYPYESMPMNNIYSNRIVGLISSRELILGDILE